MTELRKKLLTLMSWALMASMLGAVAAAQRGTRSVRVKRLSEAQANLFAAGIGVGSPRGESMEAGVRPAIMLTGYWPPTNGMLREFSPDLVQNPGGWIGSDWEGRGYDVYAYFPEFPNGLGQGVGDLEVDYQDTSADFWPLADNLKPVAVITYSRGWVDNSWEVEWVNRNHSNWTDDYTAPLQPTPAPPDASIAPGAIRNSALPVQDVVDALVAMNLNGAEIYIDLGGGGGGFLSEFIGYHGVWYQSLHADPADPAWCVAAGHVHVGAMNGLFRATKLSKQILRSVIRYVDEVMGVSGGYTQWFCPTSSTSETTGAVLTARGSYSLYQNDLELYTILAPSQQFGLAFCGATQTTPTSFGDGQLCIQAPYFRLGPPQLTNAENELFVTIDTTQGQHAGAFGHITPGSSWNFQVWLRDPQSTGVGFNLSSALGLTFAP